MTTGIERKIISITVSYAGLGSLVCCSPWVTKSQTGLND